MNIPELFGTNVFNERAMEEYLEPEDFGKLLSALAKGCELDITIADKIADAMKRWAIDKGATHYTHWFQPMTGITAEKHNSFVSPSAGGGAIMEFSGKELIKGESDASSFPSGGLRATFEARGYTAWDPTSFAFIKDGVLCIPTAFCSYGGEILDKKTPLLRSMEILNKHSMRILRALGDRETNHVLSTVGAEQEYFLIDRKLYERRIDLKLTGRTLFGAKPPKGQELDEHFLGSLRPRVSEYMKELDLELWKLGIYSKTEHNEVAPSQHELAPIFETTNIACDQNQLIMEMMKRIAEKHGLACLLHEKPFNGVNGSGKHNNWSISTSLGKNLLKPGKEPEKNLSFLLFLSAVIKAVDVHQDLLRVSAATAGNDYRLGGDEAPPAIISIYLGDDITQALESVAYHRDYRSADKIKMNPVANVLPDFTKDTADRNRTSPFAFTGNKFEFRMVGSSMSIAEANIILNTAVADVLSGFADILEDAFDVEQAMYDIIHDTYEAHKRIIFNGNNYSKEWELEAEARGLKNYTTTVEAFDHFTDDKNIELFARHNIFTPTELRSRGMIMFENYNKLMLIEAKTMPEMAKKEVLPSVMKEETDLLRIVEKTQIVGLERKLSNTVSRLNNAVEAYETLCDNITELDEAVEKGSALTDEREKAFFIRDTIRPIMAKTRKTVDEFEKTGSTKYPYPSYCDLLFSV